jgi:hypothetical protein
MVVSKTFGVVGPQNEMDKRRLEQQGGYSRRPGTFNAVWPQPVGYSPQNVGPVFGINAYPGLIGENLTTGAAPAGPTDAGPTTEQLYDFAMSGGLAGSGSGSGSRDWGKLYEHEKEIQRREHGFKGGENDQDRAVQREIAREKRKVERENSKRRAKVAYWGMGADIVKQGLKPPPPVVVGSAKPNPELAMFRKRGGGFLRG